MGCNWRVNDTKRHHTDYVNNGIIDTGSINVLKMSTECVVMR